jgi:hypothetical protein
MPMPHVFIILFFLSLVSQAGFTQSRGVSVDYLCKVNSIKTDTDKKIPIKRIIYTDDSTYTEQDSISQNELLSRVSFEKNKNVRAFARCSYTVFDNNSPRGLDIHTPDTLRYCNNKWTSVSRSKSKALPDKKVIVEKTKEHKVILGYLCDKFLVKDINTGEKYIIWASHLLPETLNPVTGLTSFKYGILEVQEINDTWSVSATKIVKLK